MNPIFKSRGGVAMSAATLVTCGAAMALAGASDDAAFSTQLRSIKNSVQAPPARAFTLPVTDGARSSAVRAPRYFLSFDATHSRYNCEDKNYKKGRNRISFASVEASTSGECVDFHKDPKLAVKNDGRLGGDGYLMSMARLSGANLQGADLRNFGLNGSDLSRANLRGADLRQADLTGVNLAGANLNGADMSGAKLDATQLGGASYNDKTKLPWSALADHRAAKAGMVKTIAH